MYDFVRSFVAPPNEAMTNIIRTNIIIFYHVTSFPSLSLEKKSKWIGPRQPNVENLSVLRENYEDRVAVSSSVKICCIYIDIK